ncbi:DNA polymerase III beta subunit [Hydrogenispora ethanolica]|jgi:DNA polymerase-3 subunit beta|uniref:Beta sliding clamp n=1 Tax=Hydrogenispora ethanolica TaxID=1082276 RepID=A0A4R1SA06_HYDET|nr:DNA polymerase III subunit beta [Hydrogenispora ethanolica]TCL76333.1 DNA polymerase III beta subunit [Hydrogenispora ethanolica]
MNITCQQEELARFLQITARALATKSTLPILTGVLLETKEDHLRCVATDLEIAIEVRVPNIQIMKPGILVLPGRTFVEIVRHLPAVPVSIELDENSKMVNIRSKHSTYQLPTLPMEEFPAFPESKNEQSFSVSGEKIREAIKQTIFATLAEDPRPFLSSILWEVTPGNLRFVATDVNRLALKDTPVQSDFQKTALVPVRALREIANIFGNSNEELLNVFLDDKFIFMKGLGITFSSRLVEAQFPRYEQVIPKEFNRTVKVQRSEIIEALERTALVSYSVKLSIKDQQLQITAKEPDKGRSYEELHIEFEGPEIDIGFNAKFLLDFLKTVDSDQVSLQLIQELKPVLMQGVNDGAYQYIVMPLKLSV